METASETLAIHLNNTIVVDSEISSNHNESMNPFCHGTPCHPPCTKFLSCDIIKRVVDDIQVRKVMDLSKMDQTCK